ncbi:MAG: lamin tail domain-containing protein [Candidatus Berkelbacteria bacterium]|nr:lamin tail domain-containing protein [Candidatus Berkelbacteria bacterium]
MNKYVNYIKVLFVCAAVILIGVVATGAYFTDRETSVNNSFTAAIWSPTPLPLPSPGAANILITEVYYNPDANHGTADDEWIEIYNAGSGSVNLKGWILWDNNSSETIHENHILNPGEYALISSNASTWNYWSEPSSAEIIIVGGLELFNGLANTGDRVVLFNPTPSEKDAVSWGTDTYAFSPSVAVFTQGHSAERSNHSVDTNSASDWIDQTNPTPGG